MGSTEKTIPSRSCLWLERVCRTPPSSLPRTALQGIHQGNRNTGQQKETWRRAVEKDPKNRGLTLDMALKASADRARWRSPCFCRTRQTSPKHQQTEPGGDHLLSPLTTDGLKASADRPGGDHLLSPLATDGLKASADRPGGDHLLSPLATDGLKASADRPGGDHLLSPLATDGLKASYDRVRWISPAITSCDRPHREEWLN